MPSMSPDEGLAVFQSNVVKLEKAVFEARSRAPIDEHLLLAFPEDALVGPIFATRAQIAPFLQPVPPLGVRDFNRSSFPLVAALCDVAERASVFLVVGVAEKFETSQFNTVVAIAPNGTVVGRARKHHLYFEGQYDAGPVHQPERLFDSPFGVVGLCVCFDVLFSDILFGDLARADVVVSVSWWVNVSPLSSGIGMHAAIRSLTGKNVVAPSSGFNWANSGSAVFWGALASQAVVVNTGWSPETQIALLSSVQASRRLPGARHRSWRRSDMMSARPFHVKNFVAAKNLTFVGDSWCNATMKFADVPEAGERYGVLSFSGPYTPQSHLAPLFWLELCAVVKCAFANDDCASLYGAVANVTAVSVFAELSLNSAAQGEIPLEWKVDATGNPLLDEQPTTIVSTAKWYMTSM